MRGGIWLPGSVLGCPKTFIRCRHRARFWLEQLSQGQLLSKRARKRQSNLAQCLLLPFYGVNALTQGICTHRRCLAAQIVTGKQLSHPSQGKLQIWPGALTDTVVRVTFINVIHIDAVVVQRCRRGCNANFCAFSIRLQNGIRHW